MSGSGSLEALVEQLLAGVGELESMVVGRQRVIAEQADRIAGLQRWLGQDFLDIVASPVLGRAVG